MCAPNVVDVVAGLARVRGMRTAIWVTLCSASIPDGHNLGVAVARAVAVVGLVAVMMEVAIVA